LSYRHAISSVPVRLFPRAIFWGCVVTSVVTSLSSFALYFMRIMHMYFAMFTSIIALPFYIFSDTIFDRMITTFLFPYNTFVVQFWVLILPNLGRTQRCF